MSHFDVLLITDRRPDEQRVMELFEPWMENCCGEPAMCFMEFYPDDDEDVDERTGERGYWQNPNARWDWLEIGGRWSNMLKAPEGFRGPRTKEAPGRFDQAVLRDVDLRDKAHLWDKAIKAWDEGDFGFYSPAWAKAHYQTAEFWARCCTDFYTHAVVVDGHWHECGKMGWFGCSSEDGDELRDWVENFEERFITPNLDRWATVVDCHI